MASPSTITWATYCPACLQARSWPWSRGTRGYFVAPAEMPRYFMSKTASTIQVHGMGPFAVNCVNPGDDPSKQTK